MENGESRKAFTREGGNKERQGWRDDGEEGSEGRMMRSNRANTANKFCVNSLSCVCVSDIGKSQCFRKKVTVKKRGR